MMQRPSRSPNVLRASVGLFLAGIGESVERRGENASRADGKEAGREDTGTDDTAAQRPTGTSTARDVTGVDPQEGPDS
jgi:hypothetical protein